LQFQAAPEVNRLEAFLSVADTYALWLPEVGAECLPIRKNNWDARLKMSQDVVVRSMWVEKGVVHQVLQQIIFKNAVLTLSNGADAVKRVGASWQTYAGWGWSGTGPVDYGTWDTGAETAVYFSRVPVRLEPYCRANATPCTGCRLTLRAVRKDPERIGHAPLAESEGLWPDEWEKQCNKRLEDGTRALIDFALKLPAWQVREREDSPAVYFSSEACKQEHPRAKGIPHDPCRLPQELIPPRKCSSNSRAHRE
jgi:hypothetical protein